MLPIKWRFRDFHSKVDKPRAHSLLVTEFLPFLQNEDLEKPSNSLQIL